MSIDPKSLKSLTPKSLNPVTRVNAMLARIPGFRWIAKLANPALRGLVGIVLAVVLVLLLVWVLLGVLPLVPTRFWQLAGLCAIAAGVLWWFLVGARRYSRRGFSKQRIGDLGPGNEDDERVPLANMRAAIAEAKGTVQRSPDIASGRDPLYRVPWMLFLGDSDAQVGSLLAAANHASPFPPPRQAADDPDQLWRWWFFKSMIAVEMHPRVVCDASSRLERGLWYQALTLLAQERDKLALNGIVICVSAQTLLAGSDAARAVGIRLRRLVDEAMEHLQLRMPVYFLVTGLDRLHGYAEFRGTLPAEAFEQALGFRLPETEVVNAATSGKLDEILLPMHERLHALRETALRSQATIAGRRGVFEFVQDLARLSDGLRVLVTHLLEDNPFQRTPRWRGLYFVGGGGGGYPAGAFLTDLFARFLPSDQPLASPSSQGDAGRLAGAGLGVVALLGLSSYLSYGLIGARQDDTRLLAQTRAACAETRDASAGGRIAWVAACGRTIDTLEAAASKTRFGFGIRRADRDIEQLKSRVVQEFSRLILAPYDQLLSVDLGRGEVGLDHALAVGQRLRLLDECRRQREVCQKRERDNNVVFDPASRLFGPFRSGQADQRIDRERAKDLFATYLGYLRWQDDRVLDDQQARLAREFERLMTRYRPRASDIDAWARTRRAPLRLDAFWLPAGRVVGMEPTQLPAVSAAYTVGTWDGVLAPWLTTLGSQLPQRREANQQLRTDYFSAYFAAWATFQARYFEGVQLWRGRYGDLAAHAASTQNPYRFFFDTAAQQLYPLPLQWSAGTRWRVTWQAVKADWLRGWRPIGRFVGDSVQGWFKRDGRIKPPPWLPAMREAEAVLRSQQPLLAKAYLRLDSADEGPEVYQLAAAFYQAQGRPADGPAADYATLLQALDKPSEKYATEFKPDDLAAWSIVQGPARLLLLLTTFRAAEYVQGRWQESIVQPLANLPESEQVAALYGDRGKLNAFVNDWLKPFVSEKELRPVRIAGVAMPLAPAFQAVVAAERQLAPAAPGQALPAGNFVFEGPTQTGALAEGSDGTVLEIDCRDRVYRASSVAQTLAEAKITVLWSPETCLEARLRVSFAEADSVSDAMDSGAVAAAPATAGTPAAPAAPAPAPVTPPPSFSLTRLYPGPEGFLQLMADFEDGFQDLVLLDFRDSYTPAQWSQLVPRLQQVGFEQARVQLRSEPSPELQRYLASRQTPASLPTRIVE